MKKKLTFLILKMKSKLTKKTPKNQKKRKRKDTITNILIIINN